MSQICPVESQSTNAKVDVKVGSPISISDEDTLLTGSGNSNLYLKSGNIARLDCQIPFFLSNDVFKGFRAPDYSWQRKQPMILLVGVPKNPIQVVSVAPASSAIAEYSIGGCPLECPFDLNEDFDEALAIDSIPTVFNVLRIPTIFPPLQINDGRLAIRKFMSQHKPFVQDLNLMHTGSESQTDSASVLAFVDCSDQNGALTLTGVERMSNSLNVRIMGRFTPDSEILSVQNFITYHEMNVFTFDNRPRTSVAYTVFEKLHSKSENYHSNGNVYLEFMFKEPTSIFELPPEDSQSKIAIRPLPGDANPSMKALWDEIEDLERWIKILPMCSEAGAGDGTSFLNSSTAYDLDFSEDKMTQNIKAVHDLLAKEPAVDIHALSSIDFSDSLDMVLQRVVREERSDCDFTDRLWSVVRKCENVEELQECLQLVFVSVANKMYRPYLLLTNATAMAKNLTRIMKGEMASLLQMRKHNIMVQVLIECGLQKLFKDYTFVLAMSHLIQRGGADHFTPSSDIFVSLNNLKRLHCILEVMCLTMERLSLSVNIQEGHVKKMLREFSEQQHQPFTWNNIYHFDVLPKDIRRAISGAHPFYYKLKMESKTLLKWCVTSVVVSTEQYIHHKRNPEDEIHARLYYVYVITQSGRLKN